MIIPLTIFKYFGVTGKSVGTALIKRSTVFRHWFDPIIILKNIFNFIKHISEITKII